MTDTFNTFIGMLNHLVSETCISRKCSEEEALNNVIIPLLSKELRDRKGLIMNKKDLDILNKSVDSLKASKKEVNLLKNVMKTLEEIMHGDN